MRIIVLVIALVVSALGIAQPVFKWTDAQGVVHYGDEPPVDAKAQEVHIEAAPARVAGSTSAQAGPLDIVMYARADCGYCAKARRYFAERGGFCGMRVDGAAHREPALARRHRHRAPLHRSLRSLRLLAEAFEAGVSLRHPTGADRPQGRGPSRVARP